MSDSEDEAMEIVEKLTTGKRETVMRYIEELQAKISDLEEAIDRVEVEDLEDAIHAFCDVVDRPCGTLKFHIPETGEKDRAISRLFHAIGRPI